MSGIWLVLSLAALPAAGNLLGGVLAEVATVSERRLSLALHLAAAIVLAVVGLELMPAALAGGSPWLPLLTFVAGGGIFIVLDRLLGYVGGRLRGGESTAGALAIFSGVSIGLFSDGVMIGTGTVVNPALGLLLALGQVPADVPEGFAAIATRVHSSCSTHPPSDPNVVGLWLPSHLVAIPARPRISDQSRCCPHLPSRRWAR